MTREISCDVLVVGAGCGGVAAALAASASGRAVVLTEPTPWVGGQLTSQAVPPDEHPWVETTGVTSRYRAVREGVRARYRARPSLTPAARADPRLNPGQGWVSGLCAEPVVVHDVLREMLAGPVGDGRLRVLCHHRPVDAETTGDRVDAVTVTDVRDGTRVTVTAAVVLDATEEGDLLPLVGAEHVVGAESAADTGEPHALDGPADPNDQQALTWCAAVTWRPGEDGPADPPVSYASWRAYRPGPFWPGPLLGWDTQEPETGAPLRRPLFGADGEQDLWTFRRLRYGGHHDPPVPDVTLLNWPQADYVCGPVVGVPAEERAHHLAGARELSLSLVHWLRTEAPRPDGGTGYPEIRPDGEPLGTDDGLALAPYVREARRLRAERTLVEQDLGVDARPGADRAATFDDTVGVGCYRIDLHPSTAGRGYLDIPTYPFQLPMGALIPVRVENLLAAGKCLGVTHVTNGCTRLHPVEWAVGEAAGTLAVASLAQGVPPRAVRADPRRRAEYQRVLAAAGVPLAWPEHVRTYVR